MIAKEIHLLGQKASKAARLMANFSAEEKNKALRCMASSLEDGKNEILAQNQIDLLEGRKANLKDSLLDRLELNDARIEAMIKGITAIIKLDDPVGTIIEKKTTIDGLHLQRIKVPIGVIGIIYESRPNVTADTSALCIKSGNAVILRGGKEAIHSNRCITRLLKSGINRAVFPQGAIQLIQTTDREAIRHFVQMTEHLDLIIPRGGEGLIKAVAEMSHVPLIKHYKGVCHVYIDKDADKQIAKSIAINAKVQRPAVCNAMETLLVQRDIAKDILPEICRKMQEHSVELRGDQRARKIFPNMSIASEKDWYEEYLDLILSVKIVDDVKEAIDHINKYGFGHSDAIITKNKHTEGLFVKMVDSAVVYVNTSTRFTDGMRFGLGAEMGISTDKLHARGPMGIEELTTYKWIAHSNGAIVK